MENNYHSLRKVKCFLLDMDGTVYLGDKLFENVKETLAKMKGKGRIIFLTNNSSKSQKTYIEKLTRLGIEVNKEEIYTSGMATIEYLKKYHANKKVFLLGTKALKDEFIDANIELVEDNPDICVLGYDTELTYANLCKFTNFINQGKLYIATHPDINCPAEPFFVPDIGSFIELIKASTKRNPDIIIGKPYTIMGDNIKAKYNLESNEIAMIGDRIYTDIAFANNNDFVSVLVLSGESTMDDVNNSTIKEDIIVDKISDLIEHL